MSLQEILKPYKDDCRYLKSAQLNTIKQKNSKDVFLAEGKFVIPYSCYISSTNHFNSVEFNICFNQLAYFLLYECIKNQLLHQLCNWKTTDFLKNQLNSMLIVKFQSVFHKKIKSPSFSGFLQIINITKKNQWLYIKLFCCFADLDQGYAFGTVLCAIPENPQLSKL